MGGRSDESNGGRLRQIATAAGWQMGAQFAAQRVARDEEVNQRLISALHRPLSSQTNRHADTQTDRHTARQLRFGPTHESCDRISSRSDAAAATANVASHGRRKCNYLIQSKRASERAQLHTIKRSPQVTESASCKSQKSQVANNSRKQINDSIGAAAQSGLFVWALSARALCVSICRPRGASKLIGAMLRCVRTSASAIGE